jgi:cytochrome c6
LPSLALFHVSTFLKMFSRIAILALLAAVAVAFQATPRFMRQSTMQMNAVSRFSAGALFVGAAFALSQPVFAADLEAGAQVFAGNCAACHAGGNNVIQNEKTLRKEALEQYLDGGLKESSIITQVTNGKNAMPAFGGRLDEEEIANVAAYVFDQATGGKWD